MGICKVRVANSYRVSGESFLMRCCLEQTNKKPSEAAMPLSKGRSLCGERGYAWGAWAWSGGSCAEQSVRRGKKEQEMRLARNYGMQIMSGLRGQYKNFSFILSDMRYDCFEQRLKMILFRILK